MTRSVNVGVPAVGYVGYLGDVAAALAGLAAPDRDELLETVVDHLESIAAESDGLIDRAALVERLGAPSSYADELASAAGLRLPATAPARKDIAAVFEVVRNWPATRAALAYLARLVPAWWAVRGFMIGGLLIAMSVPLSGYSYLAGSYEEVHLLRHWRPEVGGFYGTSTHWVVAPLLAVVVASVALGLRGERGAPSLRFWNRVVDVVGVIGLLAVPTWWLSPMFYAYVVS